MSPFHCVTYLKLFANSDADIQPCVAPVKVTEPTVRDFQLRLFGPDPDPSLLISGIF